MEPEGHRSGHNRVHIPYDNQRMYIDVQRTVVGTASKLPVPSWPRIVKRDGSSTCYWITDRCNEFSRTYTLAL